MGEWISCMNEEAGILPSDNTFPYFLNIEESSPYFTDAQTAVEYGILSTSYPFAPEEPLTKEWAAYTLVHLSGHEISQGYSIKDRSDSLFPKEIETAVNMGLMQLDHRSKFYPKKELKKDEAKQLLEKVISYINHPILKHVEDVKLNDNVKPIQVASVTFQEENMEVWFETEEEVAKGSVIYWIDEDGREQVFEIVTVQKDGFGWNAIVKALDPLSYLQEIHLEGETDVNFDDVQIFDEDAVSSSNSYGLQFMAVHKKTRTIQGYTVSYSVSSSGIRAEISKTLEHGEKMYANFELNGIKVKYKWFSQKDNLDNAFFQIEANTQENLGVSKAEYRKLFGDFSALSSQDFIHSLSSFLKPKSDVSAVEIPICTLQVPVTGSSTLTLKAKLSILLYATGETKLALTQNHLLGMEMRNGHARMIHEFKHNQECSIRAETGMTGNTTFSLNFLQQNLMDIAVSAGAKAKVSAIAHLYDEDGKDHETTLDYPIDIVEDLSQENQNVFICGDMQANWVLKMQLNSTGSLLGKFGFGKSMDILNAENAPLLSSGSSHIENWKIVPSCTYRNRKRMKTEKSLSVTERIRLNSYSLIVSTQKGTQIVITGLPKGYSVSDLYYETGDSTIAAVSENGYVTGLRQGSTQITIQTKDGSYSVICSILVTK